MSTGINPGFNLLNNGGATDVPRSNTTTPVNNGNWWNTNGSTVVQTAGSVLTSIFGRGGQSTDAVTYQYGVGGTRNVNWLGILLGAAIIGGLGYIVYKAVKK